MSDSKNGITGSLEDYLEAILRILGTSSVARVRDIADKLQVSPASVTPAMKRLAELGLIRYSKRSYIELTEKGAVIARRTATRHSLLSRFLTEILGTDSRQAEEDACAMEHHLSDSSMERLAAFFEFIAACPELGRLLDSGFGSCLEGLDHLGSRCSKEVCPLMDTGCGAEQGDLSSLAELPPGCSGKIARIKGGRADRRSLIDMGFIQGVDVTMDRPGSEELPCIVRLDGYKLDIPLSAALIILLHRVDGARGGSA
jgi:DtxR family Mn-dependent transcriptional regulator